MFDRIFNFLSSVKLALALLVVILTSCLAGVTIFRGERAWGLIFSTLWFNGLLVFLVVNVMFCFFPRMWGRKLTLISLGMILFHLSFVAILGGIVYNSLFYFRGLIRLTEGEVLPSGDPRSYDVEEHGRYFSFTKLKGETALIEMHKGYRVDGEDKQAAYEVAVGAGAAYKQGMIYTTHKLEHNGFEYFREKEGYSLLVFLYDKAGKELYGAHIPLQSLKQKENQFLYTTGTKLAAGALPFPQEPLQPLFSLQAVYLPPVLPAKERDGEAILKLWPLHEGNPGPGATPLAEGKASIGSTIRVGDYYLSPREVRYWVGMSVRFEPGKPIVLVSLWAGLGGIIITFIGRIMRDRRQLSVMSKASHNKPKRGDR